MGATYPRLPNAPGDNTGIGNLRITQYHGTGTAPGNYTGAAVLINPADTDISWNVPTNRWQVSFSVVGFSGFYVHTGLAVLPVSLAGFQVFNVEKTNYLKWTTLQEQDMAFFDIERSADGIHYENISRVLSPGNSMVSREYNYADNISGINSSLFYYRIRMVNTDGTAKYTAIVVVKFKGQAFDVRISPNPFDKLLSVGLQSNRTEPGVIAITDINGHTYTGSQ